MQTILSATSKGGDLDLPRRRTGDRRSLFGSRKIPRACITLSVDAMFCPLPADVAQLVEQRFRKPQVTGSNPVVGFYITSPQLSSADASRQTRAELSPSTTTIISLPGRVPLAIKHLPAASV